MYCLHCNLTIAPRAKSVLGMHYECAAKTGAADARSSQAQQAQTEIHTAALQTTTTQTPLGMRNKKNRPQLRDRWMFVD